ncbi:MAG: glycerol kinase GlpK [Clostridia bacterium]|nr:glycerol kinase GlpK [Clostridia bacterium]
MKNYILALDEGTTSARAILFDREAKIVSVAQNEFTQIYPQPGWVEHDAMEIYASQYAALTECVAQSGISPSEIAAVGITNQRETTVVWDKNTGRPVCGAIVWQCRRTADICEKLIADGHSDYIRQVTGLRPDAYFSGTKIKWILDNVDGARDAAERGELLFGTVDTWLLWKLTDGKVHATDRTNASRTMLYNIETGEWDDKLLSLLGIPRSMLPEVRSSSEIYGYVDVMGEKVPVSGIAGDQQAALFGQCCFSAGEVKNTYGTGCFLLANTGTSRVDSKSGLLTTVAATEKGRPVEFALEGSVFVGGAVIQWLRDEMRFISDAADSEYFAKKVPDTGGVYVVPAFSGLGAPHWNMSARGTITGITRGTKPAHIIRAALESIAFQTGDLIEAIRRDVGGELTSLKVDGGASANDFLMQFQSDVSDITVRRPVTTEATAAGAAYLAGLAVGFFESRDQISRLVTDETVFEPHVSPEEREKLLGGWKKALNGCSAASV